MKINKGLIFWMSGMILSFGLALVGCASTPAGPYVPPALETITLKYASGNWGEDNQAHIDMQFPESITKGKTYVVHIAGTADHDIPLLRVGTLFTYGNTGKYTVISETTNVTLASGIKANTPFEGTCEITAAGNGGPLRSKNYNLIQIDGATADGAKAVTKDPITIKVSAFSITVKQ